MENNYYKVLGIMKRPYTEGKNAGKTGCTYHLSGSFSSYDQDTADVSGERVFSEFAYKDFGVQVGDTVDVVYGKGYQDKAVLENIYPVKVPFKEKEK